MSNLNDIVLRPRFKMELPLNNETILKAFELEKGLQSKFIVSRIDDHVFIKFPKAEQHFWSPQLHLEINEISEDSSLLYGLFGPNPTVWTLFMFLHFMVAGVFIAFCVWAYTNWSLNTNYSIQATISFLMIIVWVLLYFAGSIGKNSSKKEMHDLNDFMTVVLRKLEQN